MRERQVLWVIAYEGKRNRCQYLMLSEVRYINAMLKDGLSIQGVKLETVTDEDYKNLFGK